MRASSLVVAVVVAVFGLPISLVGQTTQAVLHGIILDGSTATAKALDNVRVTCRNKITGEEFQAEATGPEGAYSFANLTPGEYVLEVRDTVRPPRYQAREIHGVQLGVAADRTLNPELMPFISTLLDQETRTLQGNRITVSQREYGIDINGDRTVTVETLDSSQRLLDASRSDLMRPNLYESLPLSGRDVFAMLLTQPGVTANSGTVRSLGMEAGGQRPSSSNFLLDGIEFNNYLVTGPLFFIPPESVQEYRVSTNNFSAEFGGTTGFQANVVTRYGGQSWRGALYSTLQNRALDAERAPHGPEREWRVGYEVGGPLAKDLFFSTTFDFLRDHTVQKTVIENLPSAAFLRFPSASSYARQLLSRFAPPATPSSSDGDVSNLAVDPPVSLDQWLFLNRIDYRLPNHKDRLMLRAAASELTRPDFIWSPYPDFVSGLKHPVGSVALAFQLTPGPSLTNELRGGYTAANIHWDRAHPEIPSLNVIGGNPGFERPLLPGSPAPYAFRYRSADWELHDHLTKLAGKHVFTAGGGVLARHVDAFLDFLSAGSFYFGNMRTFGLDSPMEFLGAASRLPGSPDYGHSYRNLSGFGFVNDTLRFSSRFSANVGVRYESAGAPVSLTAGAAAVQLGPAGVSPAGLLGAKIVPLAPGVALYPGNHANWGVRAGFSYDVAGHGGTVIRGGYGIFYDRVFDNLWLPAALNSVAATLPLQVTTTGDCRVYASAGCVRSLLASAGSPSDALMPVVLDPHMRAPYAQNFFGAVQQKLTSDWSLEVDAIGSLGTHWMTTDRLNRTFTLQSELTYTAENGDPTRYSPHLPELAYRGSQGSSHYEGLTAEVWYRSKSLYFRSAYTLSHSFDNQSDPLAGDFFNLGFTANGVANQGRTPGFTRQYDSSGDRGSSDFDQRHNWVEFLIWNVPSVGRGFARRMTQGWQLSELGAFRTGFPFSVLVSGAIAPSLSNNRANVIGPPNLGPSIPAPGGRYVLNPLGFTPPDPGMTGTSARNQFYGPGLYNVDLSVSKRISFGPRHEGRSLQLRLDAYNVLNHLNLGPPANIWGTADFGLSTYGRSFAGNGFPIIAPLNETARRLEILLKLQF